MTEGFCPHCGFNLSMDEPISRGDWLLSPHTVWLRGERLRVTPFEAGILHTLAKADGRPVTPEAIANRLGSQADDPGNLCSVMVHRLRERMPDVPIETSHGLGYRWAA